MKRMIARALVAAVVVGVASLAWAAPDKPEGTWTGYVTETHCGAKGAKASHAECAVKCVKEKGAKWALYDPDTKAVFVLSGDDAMAEKMAGKKVVVKGSMNKETKTITVANMEQGP